MDTDEFSLLDPRFTDPVAAAEYLEGLRWADGVVCPHCGESEREPYRLNSKATTRRLWKCRACRKQFTVMVGTIFESSHVPLNKWLAAFYLLCSSKKGMSAHQLHRMIDVSYKTAWFLFHRIREAMHDPSFAGLLGGVVEVDETYVGGRRKKGGEKGRSRKHKTPVVALIERGGKARTMRVADVTGKTLKGAIREHVDPSARIMTDEWSGYRNIGREFAGHDTVSHSYGEYGRGEIHVNTAESYFAILKRGVNGVYHHVSREHLPRYLAEFEFRYNSRDTSDSARTVKALLGAEGKRLMYQQPRPQAA